MIQKQLKKQLEEDLKRSRAFKIAVIKGRLAAPVPTSYGLWYALHHYLERLEMEDL